MGNVKPRVALVQSAIGQYRTDFIAEVRGHFGPRITVACGDRSFDRYATAIPADLIDVHLTNVFLLGNRFLYQKGIAQVIRKNKVLVMELNPRVLSVWTAVLLKRFLGKRVILWGHFNGRTSGEIRPRFSRRLLASMADSIIAYTELDVEKFVSLLPTMPIYLAANATERQSSIAPAPEGQRSNFVYSGRLMPTKNVEVLLRGFMRAVNSELADSGSELLIIGDGPSREALESLANELGIAQRTRFLGEVFDSERLDNVYGRAVAALCGGYVGLNITQALSRGVPFIYCRGANHSPEISLAVNGFNSFVAENANPEDFSVLMTKAFRESREALVRHKEIQAQTLRTYSVESMSKGFIAAAEMEKGCRVRRTHWGPRRRAVDHKPW